MLPTWPPTTEAKAEQGRGGNWLTAVAPSVNNHGSIPQAGKQVARRVLEAQHRAALGVVQGQRALRRRVHAAVHQDAARRERAEAGPVISAVVSDDGVASFRAVSSDVVPLRLRFVLKKIKK